MNSALQTLYLGDNALDERACQAIGDALKVNSTLQTLDLRYNKISTTDKSV